MDNKYHEKLIVSSSPHMVTKTDTSKIMGTVLIALLPAFAVGIYQFGFRVVTLTAVFVASCVLFEYLYNKITKKPQTVGDLSAVLTGVLLAFNCPSSLPYEIAIVGSFAAIVVIKQLFGGIGQNLVNPAVTARVFMFIAFATPMTSWPTPRGGHATGAVVDATTSATPLGVLSHGSFADVYNDGFTKMDLFLGNVGGCIGEVSALAILIGGLFLIWKKVISPIIPVTFIATVFVLGLIWGGFDGALFHILAGGLMLGAWFMATDYVTSPVTGWGQILYGVGCGCITVLIRYFGSYPEGVSYAILMMNACVVLLDKVGRPRRFGLRRKEAAK